MIKTLNLILFKQQHSVTSKLPEDGAELQYFKQIYNKNCKIQDGVTPAPDMLTERIM